MGLATRTLILAAGVALAACGSGAVTATGSTEPGTSATHRSSTAQPAAVVSAPKPAITNYRIPFPQKRKREMRAYAMRHYGLDSFLLRRRGPLTSSKLIAERSPQVIVEHYAGAGSASAVYNTFAPDHPDPELHELPNVCAHFVISDSGKIYSLVPLRLMCRHTVGLNYTAIGIEHTGFSDGDVMGNRRKLRASLKLTRWLICTYNIKIVNVIGHNESLSSPFHYEKVARLRTQTHGDMRHATMVTYRHKLRALNQPHCN